MRYKIWEQRRIKKEETETGRETPLYRGEIEKNIKRDSEKHGEKEKGDREEN